jgi:hypoxanthine phosphoribosyltransferase
MFGSLALPRSAPTRLDPSETESRRQPVRAEGVRVETGVDVHPQTDAVASKEQGSPTAAALPTLAFHMSVYDPDIEQILITHEQIQQAVADLGAQITREYVGKDLLLVGVLKGAFVMMADLSRHINLPMEFDFMAVSSYGAATQTSGVVRILKDLDHEIQGRNVLLVEDIVDSGLTLSYLLKNLRTRRPASLEVCALLQKTDAQQVAIDLKYRAFGIPPVFVVGYGLDYGERFRNLPYIGTLRPEVYRDAVS